MGGYTRIPDKVRDDIIRRLKSGEKQSAIAQDTHIAYSTVNRFAREIGIIKFKKRRSPTRRKARREVTNKQSRQLCWSCRKATGFCPWSHNLTPVEGWTAEKVKTETYTTYHINACPLYEKD